MSETNVGAALRAQAETFKTLRLSRESYEKLPAAVCAYIAALETNADPAGMVRDNVDLRDQRDALAARVNELYAEIKSAVGELRDRLTVLAVNRSTVAEMALPLAADLPLAEMRDAERGMEARLHRLWRVVQTPK